MFLWSERNLLRKFQDSAAAYSQWNVKVPVQTLSNFVQASYSPNVTHIYAIDIKFEYSFVVDIFPNDISFITYLIHCH